MSFSLTMLNLWIGLCQGIQGFPSQFRDWGYTVASIDSEFRNQDRDRVAPDLVVTSEIVGHTLLLEWKSGANTEPDQLDRYARVSAADLSTRAYIPPRGAQSHDVAIVGQDRHGDRLAIGVQSCGHGFPLLVADAEGLALKCGGFRRPNLTSLFSPRLEIPWSRVPQGFVPIDGDSEDWEVAEILGPQLLTYMMTRRASVKADEICADLCKLWWSMGQDSRIAFKKRLYDIVLLASHAELRAYLRVQGHQQNFEVGLVNNPLNLSRGRRAAALRRMRKLHGALLARLAQKRPYRVVEQFDMFGEPVVVGPIVEPGDDDESDSDETE